MDEGVDHVADEAMTVMEEERLADWDEYTTKELIAMGGVDPDAYELGEGP